MFWSLSIFYHCIEFHFSCILKYLDPSAGVDNSIFNKKNKDFIPTHFTKFLVNKTFMTYP